MQDLNLYDYIIYCLWQGENSNDITVDMFSDDYKKLYTDIQMLVRNNTKGDIFLLGELLGKDIALRFNEIGNNCSVASFWHYKVMLFKQYYKSQISKAIMEDNIDMIVDLTASYEKAIKPENKKLKVYDQNTNLQDYIDELDNRIAGRIDWYDWGVQFLDKYIGKLRMGKLIVLKGKRKFGKTTMSTMIANSFLQRDLPVIFITTESWYTEILDKLLSTNSQINSYDIKQGKIGDRMGLILDTIQKKMAFKKNKIVQCTKLNVKNIEELIDEHQPKIVVIDYLQRLIIDKIPQGMNHSQVMTQMSNKLKNLCLDKNISILALSQVNDAGDTRDCKSFEADADCILWIYENEKEPETNTTNRMYLDITNRDGNSCKVDLVYNKTFSDYAEYTNEKAEEYQP